MTVDDVRAAVAKIAAMADYNDETAHSKEDELHQRVLEAIAKGECDDPRACAAEALKTVDIDFARWCA
jgi:DNA-binding FadR family transcriptional regulator